MLVAMHSVEQAFPQPEFTYRQGLGELRLKPRAGSWEGFALMVKHQQKPCCALLQESWVTVQTQSEPIKPRDKGNEETVQLG